MDAASNPPAKSLRRQLEEASEDDVLAALEGSYVEDVLDGIAPDVLLEFFRRMIDQRLGRVES